MDNIKYKDGSLSREWVDEEVDNFCNGASMAYKDCAVLCEEMAKNLPDELKFLEDQFKKLGKGMRQKSDHVWIERKEFIHGKRH